MPHSPAPTVPAPRSKTLKTLGYCFPRENGGPLGPCVAVFAPSGERIGMSGGGAYKGRTAMSRALDMAEEHRARVIATRNAYTPKEARNG